MFTIISITTCFGWGAVAWFTGSLIMAEDLPLLSMLTNFVYLTALVAPFIKARLRRVSTVRLLVVLSILSIGGLAIMMVEPYVPLGYATVGILRLFLVPVLMSFGENNLGAVAGV
ncbi:MAG: hypothetical protein ACRCYY_09435, partial [Trueperaceae bacterium]